MNKFMDIVLSHGQSSNAYTCPVQQSLLKSSNFPYQQLTSLFLFLSSHVGVDGFITNISVGSSFGWYFRVDQFELIFLGLLMLQIFVLRYIDILPININNLFLGSPSGKRKKRALSPSLTSPNVCKRNELADSMLGILKKLDDGQCLPLVLCHLQSISKTSKMSWTDTSDFELPEKTKQMLDALNMSGNHRATKIENCDSSPNMIYFEKAVNLGDTSKNLDSTICQDRYHACPLTMEDIVHYVGIISNADMLG